MSFLIGTDTLSRFFEPKYYESSFQGGMPEALTHFFNGGSTIISARRGKGRESRRLEEDIVERDDVVKWTDDGRIRLLGDGTAEWVGISSTAVREALRGGDRQRLKTLVIDEIAEYIQDNRLYD